MAIDVGAARVVISGDYSKLSADFAAAQGIAATGAAAIGSSVAAGYQQAGQAGLFLSASTRQAIAAQQALVPAATAAAGAVTGLGRATVATTVALGHQVSQLQAVGGALRVADGNGGLRAAERFLTMIPGIGAALQTAFPLIGLIALSELLTRVTEKFHLLGGGEDKAAEEAKKFQDEMRKSADSIGNLSARLDGIKYGAAAEDADKLAQAQEKVNEAQRNLTAATGGTPGKGGRAVQAEPAPIVSPQLQAMIKAQQDLHIAQLQVRVDAAQLKKQQDEDEQRRLEKLMETSEEYLAIQKSLEAMIDRRNSTRSQSLFFGGLGPLAVEAPDEAPFLKLEEGLEKTSDEFLRKIQEAAQTGARLQEEAAKAQGETNVGGLATRKLQVEQIYQAEVFKTAQQQIAYQQQLNALDDAETQAKIDALVAVRQIQLLNGDVVQAGSTQIQIDREKVHLAQQQIEEQTKLTKILNDNNLARQLEVDLIREVTNGIPSSVGHALASGIFGGGKHGEDVGTQVVKALESSGKQLLGEAFTAIITKLLAEAIIQTGLQAVLVKIGLSKLAGGTPGGIYSGGTAGVSGPVGHGPAQVGLTPVQAIQTGVNVLDNDLKIIDNDLQQILAELRACGCNDAKAGGSSHTGAIAGGAAVAGAVLGAVLGGGGGDSSTPSPQMVQTPGAAALSRTGPSLGVANISNSTSGGGTQVVHIGEAHFHGVQDTREMMRQIADLAKTASPSHSPYSK